MRIVQWVLVNGATLLGCLQAIIKAIKELLTGVINLLSLIIPTFAAQVIVDKVRAVLNKIDEVVEKLKGYLLPNA